LKRRCGTVVAATAVTAQRAVTATSTANQVGYNLPSATGSDSSGGHYHWQQSMNRIKTQTINQWKNQATAVNVASATTVP